MATFYTSSNNQRDSLPMFYLRDPLLSSYSEAPIFPSNMMMYMNYPSSLVSKQQNNFMEIPMVAASESPPEQQEVLLQVGDFNGWKRNEMLVIQQSIGSGPSNILNNGQNFQSQGLSLTLSTQIPSAIQISSMPHCHLIDSLLSPSNLFDLGDGGCRDGSSKEEHYRSGEYHLSGYQESIKGDLLQYSMPSIARLIPNCKYLKAAQQLLDEVVNVKKALNQFDNERKRSPNEDGTKTSNNEAVLHENGASSSIQESESGSPSELSHAERQDLQNKLTKLLSMLDEVDRRYKQYYHQMQIAVSSFDAIAGCGAAKPYTALALQTISRHFRFLRDTISGQIRVTRKSLGEKDFSGSGKDGGIPRLRYVDQQLRQQKALQQLGMVQQHGWRPQRGLPETSVSILRAWLFEHFLHPYPKDSDKIMLARQTGLTRNQVSNWFINARVRLWKPMVEEMHKEEMVDVEIDSNSSSEDTAKAAKGDKRAAEDTGEDLQQSASSTATQLLDSMTEQVTNAEMEGPTRLHGREARNEYGWVKRRIEPRPNVDDSNVFRATNMAGSVLYNVAELGRFGQGNGVSLTLGLQHCENRNVLMGLRGDRIYNGSAASLGGTVDFECMNTGNTQRRFGSSHLYHDFVV